MVRNWLEEVVAELWRLKGYMVLTDVDLPMPVTSSRRVRGHSDIDVLAIKEREIVHIECENWWGPSRDEENKKLGHLKERFDVAPLEIKGKFPFLTTHLNQAGLRKVFVTSGKPRTSRGGPWERLERFCNKHDVELKEVKVVLAELITELVNKYPRKGGLVGREESFVTRLLIQLIGDGLLSARKDENARNK